MLVKLPTHSCSSCKHRVLQILLCTKVHNYASLIVLSCFSIYSNFHQAIVRPSSCLPQAFLMSSSHLPQTSIMPFSCIFHAFIRSFSCLPPDDLNLTQVYLLLMPSSHIPHAFFMPSSSLPHVFLTSSSHLPHFFIMPSS